MLSRGYFGELEVWCGHALGGLSCRWARAVTPERRSGKKNRHSSCGFKDGAAEFRHGFRLLKIGGLLSDELSTADKSQFQEIHLCSAWLFVPGGLCVLSFGVRQSVRCFGFARLRWFSGRGFRVFARVPTFAASRPRGSGFSEFRRCFLAAILESWK